VLPFPLCLTYPGMHSVWEGGEWCTHSISDQFFWSESRRLGNGAGVGGGGGLWGSGAGWGVAFRNSLRRSPKPCQGKARTGMVSSEPLPSYSILGQTPG
jgi:hypothetical protein